MANSHDTGCLQPAIFFVQEAVLFKKSRTRKPRAVCPPVSPALLPALVVSFLQDEHLTKALVEDLFHVVACVAVSTRWAR